MSNTILHKRSSTASAVPAAGSLTVGELAINAADATIFTKKTDNSVVNIVSSNKLNVFSATTSAELAGVISDETGFTSGALLVFNTSPNFITSLTTSSASFDLLNATATTINAFGAATSISIGAATGTTTINHNLTMAGDVTLNAQKDLRFADADSSNWVAFHAPSNINTNVTWTLPAADGSSGQFLSTDGSGNLSWQTSSGGGGETANTTYQTILLVESQII